MTASNLPRVSVILAASNGERFLCDALESAFAQDYDGALWFVAGPDGLLAADTTAKRLDGAWGVSRLPGHALAVARSATRCSLVLASDESEIWTYELPSLTLRRRDPVPIAPVIRRTHRIAIAADGPEIPAKPAPASMATAVPPAEKKTGASVAPTSSAPAPVAVPASAAAARRRSPRRGLTGYVYVRAKRYPASKAQLGTP